MNSLPKSIAIVESVASTRAVLLVSHELAEWCERAADGSVRYGASPVVNAGHDGVARAVVQARAEAGGVERRCVLALSGNLLAQRTLPLPPISRADLAKVLARKSAGWLECPLDDALYSAVRIVKEASPEGDASVEHKWYVAALRRSFVVGLRSALRREGVAVTRTVDASMARLACADALRESREAACVVVDVDRDRVCVSLVSRNELRQQSQIRGSFESVPTMALSLIQEIKSFDAYWRKESRGTGVATIVAIGLDGERGKLFANAVAASLQRIEVRLVPDAAEAGTNGRAASILACGARGPLALDLSAPMPARYGYVLSLVGCLLVVTAGAGAFVTEHLGGELEGLLSSRRELESRSSELEALREQNERIESTAALARAECERVAQAAALGVPLEKTLGEAFTIVSREGELLSISADRRGTSGRLELEGVIDPDPLSSMRALSSLEQAIDASPLFDEVEVDTPEISKERSDEDAGEAPLEFQIRAHWEGASK